MTMDESAESQTILEAEMEVLNVDLGLVGGGLPLAPKQKTLFGGQLCGQNGTGKISMIMTQHK